MAEQVNNSPEAGKRDSQFMLPLLAVALVALAAVGWLAGQRFLAPGPPTATPAPTSTPMPAPTATPMAQVLPTTTKVVVEPTPTPSPGPTATPTSLPVAEVLAPVFNERVRNGSFEKGFKDNSVGLGWAAFSNGSAIFEFMDETWPPAVYDGEHAQRIQVREASQPNRYAGIYQTVGVIPGETYDLVLYGQIRSGAGDIRVSQYGYRMQLGLDYAGGQDWQGVEEWTELPWDEQPFDSDLLFFYDYATPVVPTGPRLTIFIRTWNKWADPGRVEYTLDGISLLGPALPEEIAFNEPLPETGEGPQSLSGRVRGGASVLMVMLLVSGALWRIRRRSVER